MLVVIQAGARAAAAKASAQTSVTDAPLYVVKPGDTLEKVARTNRVTVRSTNLSLVHHCSHSAR